MPRTSPSSRRAIAYYNAPRDAHIEVLVEALFDALFDALTCERRGNFLDSPPKVEGGFVFA